MGIDGYAWLHRSVATCARELALGQHSEKYLDYILRRIHLLLRHQIKPYFVFDGDRLPTKSGVEGTRDASRLQAKRLAMEYMRQGKLKLADEQFMKCVDVTPKMAHMVIMMLKRLNVPYVVAPYEADAQLVYLENHDMIDGIISEDSDLLIFGAQTLITKLDNEGNCIEIKRQNFKNVKEFSMADFDSEHLRIMAILAGCDYSPGLPKIGLIKAYRLVRQHQNMDRLLRALRLDNITLVPSDFESTYQQARLTFLHQRVYCPNAQHLVMLSEPKEIVTFPGFENFIGPLIPSDLSREIAIGNIDPITKQPFDCNLPGPKFSISSSSTFGKSNSGLNIKMPSTRCSTSHSVIGTKLITSFFSPASTPPKERHRPPLHNLNNNIVCEKQDINEKKLSASTSTCSSIPLKRTQKFIDSGSSDELEEPVTRSPFFKHKDKGIEKLTKTIHNHQMDETLLENKENDNFSDDDIPPITPYRTTKIGSLIKQPQKSCKGRTEYSPSSDTSVSFGTTLNNFAYTPR